MQEQQLRNQSTESSSDEQNAAAESRLVAENATPRLSSNMNLPQEDINRILALLKKQNIPTENPTLRLDIKSMEAPTDYLNVNSPNYGFIKQFQLKKDDLENVS